MRLLKRFRQGDLRLGRIEAFSDGVFAIVVTLLVLELKVPALSDHGSASELGHHLREDPMSSGSPAPLSPLPRHTPGS